MDWRILQLADSSFPTGGFAHSAGLEAYAQQGEIDRVDLRSWAEQLLWQTGHGALPFIRTAYEAPDELEFFDGLSEAFLRNPVANRASRLQGQSFLAACLAAFPDQSTRLMQWSNNRSIHFHYAPIFGASAYVLNVRSHEAKKVFLFTTLRSGLSAAVRLGVVGPLEAQRVQAECAVVLDDVLDACSDIPLSDAAQTAPILDLMQGVQDRLYSRLFQS